MPVTKQAPSSPAQVGPTVADSASRPVETLPAPRPAAKPRHVAAAASASNSVDQVSGPTIVPEPDIDADRRAWEEDRVPYDDEAIAAYEDEQPPFEVPDSSSAGRGPATRSAGAAGPVPERAVSSPRSGASAPDVSAPRLDAPASVVSSRVGSPAPAAAAPAAPTASASPGGGMPWATHAGAEDEIPQNEEEAKDMLKSVFGLGVKFIPADE